MNRSDEAIDAIVTWVDGSDERFRKRFESELRKKEGRSVKIVPGGRSKTRFSDNNEIEYCLRGIRTHLPWIRRIHLVTDQQKPRFLTADVQNKLSVNVVDHRTIFHGNEWALPCFNSQSIETALYRTPGLSRRHIYFNDDVIPVAATDPADFFCKGKVVVRGAWAALKEFGKLQTAAIGFALHAFSLVSNKSRTAHLLPQIHAARIADHPNRYIKTSHAPHPAYTDTLKDFFHKNKSIFEENIKYKFRHLDQFTTYPLAHHLEAMRGNLELRDASDCITINFEKRHETGKKLSSLNNHEIKFICLQGFEMAKSTEKKVVLDFLDARLTG